MSQSKGNQGVLRTSNDLLICTGCGTQYAVTEGKDSCAVCDDPRQFVPPEGQTFTTLAEMRKEYRNEWWQDPVNKQVWFCRTVPEVRRPASPLKSLSGISARLTDADTVLRR